MRTWAGSFGGRLADAIGRAFRLEKLGAAGPPGVFGDPRTSAYAAGAPS